MAERTRTNFTIVNGQIYTPGLAIIDSPQPDTPEGGDTLQVALDISGDGRLQIAPPYLSDFNTGLYNITLFLFSYTTGLNLTISNGTKTGWQKVNGTTAPLGCSNTTSADTILAGCQNILTQELGSTVKHVNWVWPDCLVGNGNPSRSSSSAATDSNGICENSNARGPYNISIHQAFRMNGSDYYTIFDLPIHVTNSIPGSTSTSEDGKRPMCAQLKNTLLPPQSEFNDFTPLPYQPYLGGKAYGPGNSSTINSGHRESVDMIAVYTLGVIFGMIFLRA